MVRERCPSLSQQKQDGGRLLLHRQSSRLPSAISVHRVVFGAAASICGGAVGVRCQTHVLWLLQLPLKIWSAAVRQMTHPSRRYDCRRPSVHRLLITPMFPANKGGGRGGKNVHGGSVHVYEEKLRRCVCCDPGFPSHNDPKPQL